MPGTEYTYTAGMSFGPESVAPGSSSARLLLPSIHVLSIVIEGYKALPLADLGGAPGARPPYGSRFFHFDMQNFRNVAASGVHGPRTRSTPPPTGNPGSATDYHGIHVIRQHH